MTVVGKILVFLVLVCSLAVGAFAVMDFTARTHWADQYDRLSKKAQTLAADRNAYKAEADQKNAQLQSLNENLGKVGKDLVPAGPGDADQAAQRAIAKLVAQAKQIDELKNLMGNLQTQLAAERKKTSQYDAVAKVAQKTTERHQADVEKMRSDLQAVDKKNTELVRDMNELRDRAVGSEIENRTLKDINKRLEGQLQELARTNARMKANGASATVAGRNGLNPPPENVEGLIRRADGNLVTITIGSDAGLVRGHTMEVFRLGQNPKYIGKVKIVDVKPTQAVAQAMGRTNGPMQVGDRVASRIMTDR
jgi:hypothetical protein